MAETHLSRLPNIGPKLRGKVWLEAMRIAEAHDHTRDVHKRRVLQAQFDALLVLIKGARS